jgi:hypothetical protein
VRASRVVHAERRRGPTAARAASRRAARAAGGGAMIRSAAAAAAALVLCGLALSAPSAAGAGDRHAAGSDDAAARASEELRVGAAVPAAVPAAARALFAKVLGRLEGMRGEMEEPKADKARSDERAESMRVRITKLEESECEDVREESTTATVGNKPDVVNALLPLDDRVRHLERVISSIRTQGGRRRTQTTLRSCDRTTFQARTDVAMDACCPAVAGLGGGHRRFLQADCTLPGTCPSAGCAVSFVSYFDDCGTMLTQLPPAELGELRGLYTSCQELDATTQLMIDWVDWWGVNAFSGPISDPLKGKPDSMPNSPCVRGFVSAAASRGFPVLIAESQPRYIGAQSREHSWSEWFEPLFDLLAQPAVKGFSYVDRNCNGIPQYKHWGDERVETGVVGARYLAALLKRNGTHGFLHAANLSSTCAALHCVEPVGSETANARRLAAVNQTAVEGARRWPLKTDDTDGDHTAIDLESSPASIRRLVRTLRESNERLELQLAACEAHHEADVWAITTSRHRKQGATVPCDARTLAGRTDAVMNACCPAPGGGHRRLQADCMLPDACPSVTCAASFIEYYDDCLGELQAHTDVLPLSDFSKVYSSCQSLESASSSGGERAFGLSVLSDEGTAISGAMFVSRQLASLEPLGSLDPLEPLAPPVTAEPTSGELASMMPTMLLPCNAKFAVDLEYDVAPAEVRVDCEKDMTIRGSESLGRPVRYGGVNRAFWVQDAATLRLERLEISDRSFTHEWEPWGHSSAQHGGDAIIRVAGLTGGYSEKSVFVFITVQSSSEASYPISRCRKACSSRTCFGTKATMLSWQVAAKLICSKASLSGLKQRPGLNAR